MRPRRRKYSDKTDSEKILEFLYRQGTDGANSEDIKRDSGMDMLGQLFLPSLLHDLIKDRRVRMERDSYFYNTDKG